MTIKDTTTTLCSNIVFVIASQLHSGFKSGRSFVPINPLLVFPAFPSRTIESSDGVLSRTLLRKSKTARYSNIYYLLHGHSKQRGFLSAIGTCIGVTIQHSRVKLTAFEFSHTNSTSLTLHYSRTGPVHPLFLGSGSRTGSVYTGVAQLHLVYHSTSCTSSGSFPNR